MQKHRIYTDIGKDQKITVELKQDYDLLEILSLKFSQKDIYSSFCSDYGVVCGRISVNNGFGVPNAKISIFIPLSSEDENDPVISALYPYKSTDQRDENNYRYNLLPSRQQHGGHAPTGTFPDQRDVLNREEVLEVYEKYYKYTVKTNSAGDFMIWGVPLGQQTIHVDVDLSDVGCFSLRPYDFIRQGFGVDSFKNKYTFKASDDIDSLPQIITFDKTIEVYPFWGNQELCEIGITRTDFDLSDQGVKIEPKAFLIGGTYTDTGKNSINKNCAVRRKMGRKCDLTTGSGKIEAIRFTPSRDENHRPILEEIELNEDVPEDGSFVVPIPMNMDYVVTNEYGENEFTNDPNKGIATSACYRFRFSLNDAGNSRLRKTASYLAPNIREYSTDVDKSYAFSTDYNDYPSLAIDTLILDNTQGQFYPKDYFYRFNYNKVYTVSSFQSLYSQNSTFTNDRYVGIKEIVPSEEEDCSSDVVTPPTNFGIRNKTFTLLISDILMFMDYLIKWIILQTLNFLVKDVLDPLAETMISIGIVKKAGRKLRRSTSLLQVNNTVKLSLLTYPECDECVADDLTTSVVTNPGDENLALNCKVATISFSGNSGNQTDRYIPIIDITGYTDSGLCSVDAPAVNTLSGLTADQVLYFLLYNDNEVLLDPTSGGSYIFLSGSTYILNDRDYVFIDTGTTYYVDVKKIGTFQTETTGSTLPLESECEIYDTLYDENLATGYFITSGGSRTYTPTISPGDDVQSTLIAGEGTNVSGSDPYGPALNGLSKCRDMESEVHYLYTTTPSYRSEFANGVFYIVPGTQSASRLTGILKEYYRRKRVAKLFCGGIVNYSFIDNWLSGSLYFFQFKVKKEKYCDDVVTYNSTDDKYYYKSTKYVDATNTWGVSRTHNTLLGRPTTFVDLGPRDEFIKEICVDPTLDPNCSVSRSIGPTSFQSFGELLGLAINYRMDVSNNTFDIKNFFDNSGFTFTSDNRVFDGDITQLISINNEAGIEEFDLQSPKYLGYTYQFLDPDLYPQVFNTNGFWGPLPVTFALDDDGQRIRLCINEPTHTNYYGVQVEGRLTESSQPVPFFLWDKKGTGFGGTTEATSDDQSWDYSTVVVQPLQGMTYGYTITGTPNDSSDKYLLLPMTNTFSGLTITGNVTTDVYYNEISLTDDHLNYDTQYPGFVFLYVTGGTLVTPTAGVIYTRYGSAGNWWSTSWDTTIDVVLHRTENYYGSKQILSTPFMFYFGLKAGKTGIDKFIDLFGPKGAFPSAE